MSFISPLLRVALSRGVSVVGILLLATMACGETGYLSASPWYGEEDIGDGTGFDGRAVWAIDLSGAPAGAQVTDVDVSYNIDHTYVGDLKVWLTTERSSQWHDSLLFDRGGDPDPWDDDLDRSHTGLDDWDGLDPNGTWYLMAADYANGDVGHIEAWSIKVYWYKEDPQPNLVADINCLSEPWTWGSTVYADLVIDNTGSGEAENVVIELIASNDTQLGDSDDYTIDSWTGWSSPDIGAGGSWTRDNYQIVLPDSPGDWNGYYSDDDTVHFYLTAHTSSGPYSEDDDYDSVGISLPKKIISAYWWEPTNVVEGTTATMCAQVSGYQVGDTFSFDLDEYDPFDKDDVAILYGDVFYSPSDGGYFVKAEWVTQWQDDGFGGGDPEFEFEVSRGGESKTSRNRLSVSRAPDTTPPSNPTSTSIDSSSHTTSQWSQDRTVDVEWSGASDDRDLAGYHFIWSDNSNTTVTTSHPFRSDSDGAGSETSDSPPLSDGTWYFHIRYKDEADNLASSTLHYGPFLIDGTAPTMPNNLTNPGSNDTCDDPTPNVMWSSSDQTGGIQYYQVDFYGPSGAHETFYSYNNAILEDSEFSGSELAIGNWTWTVTAVDNAGNSAGPSSGKSLTIVEESVAEILAFNAPQGTVGRGDLATATVRVRNNDAVRRTFWVGLSFEGPGAGLWPDGNWYDVPPLPTLGLEPGEAADITFSFSLPAWLPPGAYVAHTAVWENYDRLDHLMENELARTERPSFDLPHYTSDSPTLIDQVLYQARRVSFFDGLEHTAWDNYENGKKALFYVSGTAPTPLGVSVVGVGIPITVYVDLADYYGITPEGQDDLVTVWVDVGVTVSAGLPVSLGFTDHTFPTPDEADIRSGYVYELGAQFLCLNLFRIYKGADGANVTFMTFERDLAVSVASTGTFQGVVTFEISREELQGMFTSAWTGHLGFVSQNYAAIEDSFLPPEASIQLADSLLQALLGNIPSESVNMPASDDDGNWKPDRPLNESPADGETGVSLTPVLWGSRFQDRNPNDRIQLAQFVIDDSPDFASPVAEPENLHWTWEFATGVLQPGTTYYWKTRYRDMRFPVDRDEDENKWSEWSAPTSFTTAPSTGESPVAHIDSIVPNPTSPPGDTVTLSGVGSDDGTVVAYEWRSSLDGVLGSQGVLTISSNDFSVGQHDIYFRVRDNEGLWSDSATASLTVSNAIPTAVMDGAPSGPVTGGSTVTLQLGGTDNDEGGDSIVQGELSLDGEVVAHALGQFTLVVPPQGGTHNLSYRVRDDEGTWSNPVTASIFVEDPIQPTASLEVNGGDGQRSMVTTVTAYFSEDVSASIDDGDLVVLNLDTGETSVGAHSYNSLYNTATWTFPSGTGSSLSDGNYEVTLNASGISDAAGNLLDPDGCSMNCFRFFGDADGDRDVDFLDVLAFRATNLKNSLDPDYDPRFDSDSDGDVDFLDVLAFRANNLQRLEVPFALIVSTNSLAVPEGSQAGFTVALSDQPTGTVSVTVEHTSGDEDLSVTSGATLTFNSDNWSAAQPVTISAAEDVDSIDGSAEFTVSADSSVNQPLVVVAEEDNDAPQAGITTVWEADVTHPETATNEITRVKLTPDGQSLTVFHYNGSSSGIPGRVEKINTGNGGITWERTVTKSGERICLTGWVDGEGSLFFGPSYGGYTLWKYDSELGAEQWSYVGSTGFEYVVNLVTDDADNVYVTGYNGSNSNAGSRIVKLTGDGSFVWDCLSHNSSGKDDYTYQIALGSAGNVFRVGADKLGTGEPWQGRLLGHAAADGSEYLHVAVPESDSSVWGVATDSADNVIIAYSYDLGHVVGQPTGQERTVVQKRDQTGALVWEHRFDDAGMYLSPNAIKRYSHDVFLMAYHIRDGTTVQPGIAAFTDAGDLLWAETLGQPGWTFGTAGLDVRDGFVYTGLSKIADSVQTKVLKLQIPACDAVCVEGNAMWNSRVYISWQNITHVYQPDSTNMVIDTWKVDDNGDGDPRNDQNRILLNGRTDGAFGLQALLENTGGERSGTTASTVVNPDGSATLTLEASSTEGTIRAKYTIYLDSPDLFGELTITPQQETAFWWGISMLNSVWVTHDPGEMSLYDKVGINDAVHTALAEARDIDAVEGEDYWDLVTENPAYVALMSSDLQCTAGVILLHTDVPVRLQGSLQMSSQYSGWGFCRRAQIRSPLNTTLSPGTTYEFAAVFHADTDLSLQKFGDIKQWAESQIE